VATLGASLVLSPRAHAAEGIAAAAGAPSAPAEASVAEGDAGERLTVADPYLELHTGPGRGYPVFHVVERQATVEIVLRHTDWFKVRTDDGRLGWVHRAQLERTLTAAGATKSFRDVLIDDYLQRRFELGAAYGRFESSPLIKFFAGWRFTDTLSIDAALGQVQGVFSGSSFWRLGLAIEPWSEQRWSPFFGIGVGRFKDVPNLSLVDGQRVDANLADMQLGLRYHLTQRFMLRADYSRTTAFVADERSTEYGAYSLGLSFFF